MKVSVSRLAHAFALLLALSSMATTAVARDGATSVARAPVNDTRTGNASWLYRGSDIPPDPEWQFGELPNGLRYAVRRNGVPAGQVSIRLAIDAGSLHERGGEAGYAHFNEHLSFRGSRYVPDGEAKKLWQRLGATFGSDTNATTSPTQTIYKLDLPGATPAGIEESVKVLSGMMAAPDITQAEVDAERRTVLAELREGDGPGRRSADATRALFFAGQAFGDHSPIGSVASLNAATPATLRAFHDRWYRPERTVLVIVGDGDPATFEALIAKYFIDWHGKGETPGDPDFGAPDAAAPRTRVVIEPGVPLAVNLAVLRPWRPKADTIEYNRGKLIEGLALRLISRRLETRARAGGSFLTADVSQDDVARSVDGTFVQIVPLGNDWQAAVRDVRGVIADALVNASPQADIDREAAEIAAGFEIQVEQQRNLLGSRLADDLVEAVNIRETVASPAVARDVFSVLKDRLTPAALLAATQRMFAGAPLRAVLTTPKLLTTAEGQLLAAITAPIRVGAATTGQVGGPPISFAALPEFGQAATVLRKASVGDLGLQFIEYSNGVRAMLYPNIADSGRVFVSVRFGRGRQGLPTNRPSLAWAADSALIESGIGPFGQDALDRLTSGRKINIDFAIDDDAFVLNGFTRAADLDDQLHLMAAKLAYPRWDAAPVVRLRAALLSGYSAASASPGGVLSRRLSTLLHGGDPRWTMPTLAQIEALTPQAFRAQWEPLLATGPIEVSVFGDIDAEKANAAIAATFGALAPRTPAPVTAAAATSLPLTPTPRPIVAVHTGRPDQAVAAIAWPTAGGLDTVYEARKLDILAEIFNGRLFDQLREGEGASYSQNVASSWPLHLAGGGSFLVTAQLGPRGVDRFFQLARSIASDLAAKPASADEILRAIAPRKQSIARASSSSAFWLGQLAGAAFEPARLKVLPTLTTDYDRMTPAELQASAKRWLVPGKALALAVVPKPR